MIVINREKLIHLYCVRNKKKKRRGNRILFDNEKSHEAYSIFGEFLLFSSPFFFVVSSFKRSLIRFL